MLIEYKSDLEVQYHTNPDKGRRWTLAHPFKISVDGVDFEVPQGFWTDFASIPRSVWPIISPYDCGKGPVAHDFGYFTGIKNKYFWDVVLNDCMVLDGIAKWRCKVVYKAVDMFGWATWNNYRRQGSSASQYARLINRNNMA